MINNLYSPFRSDDFTFCEIFTCIEKASWVCYPQGVFTYPLVLCDQHKREKERERVERVQVEQVETVVEDALRGVDPNDAGTFYGRCGEILDEIHAGHL